MSSRGSLGLLTRLVALLAIGLLLSALAGVGCGSGPAALRVLPFPGTPDASPQTHVALLSLSPSDVAKISVRGSRSGAHTGMLTPLRSDDGAVFMLDKPFAAGERVAVRVETTTKKAAASAGGGGGTQLFFTFRVAAEPNPSGSTTTTAAPTGSAVTATGSTPASGGQGGAQQQAPPTTWTFLSRPDLHPPQLSVPVADGDPDSGLMFLDAEFAPQNGPLILDGAGNVVWFQGLSDGQWATDVAVQTYQGRPVLTWWQGSVDTSGHGSGEDVILDTSYRPVATVKAGAGYSSDLHEFVLTTRGTALITVYQPVKADLTAIGAAKDGAVYDSIIQEVDVSSGRVLWEWHALGHIPITDSYQGLPSPGQIYDFFHINSVQELDNGDLLVSARNTWAVYRIDRGTGAVLWQLGGKRSNFAMAPGTQFEWQHDARLLDPGTLTLFNNAAAPGKEPQSRALIINLDTQAMTAKTTTSFTHTPPVLAGSQGSVRQLRNGNWFVGWGDQPYFSEFKPDGTVVFDVKFPGTVQSYRAKRSPWTAQPVDPPATVLGHDVGGNAVVYVSWNGATEVAGWQAVGGQTADTATPLANVPRTGFETAVPIGTVPAFLAVQALDAKAKVLATAIVQH